MFPGNVNNDAENNPLNERPLDGVGATVNLGRDEEVDISEIHHDQAYKLKEDLNYIDILETTV